MNTKSTASSGIQIDWKRIMFLMIGIILFAIVNYSPPWPDALDPMGKAFILSPQGKAAIALFLLAGTWWVFEVVPIGVTGLAIGVVQAFFHPAGRRRVQGFHGSVGIVYFRISHYRHGVHQGGHHQTAGL